ncbi:hypothetical protein DERP_009163, partial [Dermatophagoides pteronyssinus]
PMAIYRFICIYLNVLQCSATLCMMMMMKLEVLAKFDPIRFISSAAIEYRRKTQLVGNPSNHVWPVFPPSPPPPPPPPSNRSLNATHV